MQVREREELELQDARQKASIKWLVCKAYSNKPPANILDPYYKDHQDKDRLKPAVLHSLANAVILRPLHNTPLKGGYCNFFLLI